MDKFITLVSMAILLQVRGEIPGSMSCISKRCHAVLEISSNFQTALDMCNGTLMTVQSNISNGVIRDLFADVKGEFWIGLRFNDKGCTDTSSELRGYEWVTGDPFTEFSNWSGDETFCTPMCVSVSRDLKWTERPCSDNIDGFLCERDYSHVCEALKPEKSDISFHYVTPLGNKGEGVNPLALPQGSIVTVKPSGIRYICAPEVGWMRAPWPCEVGKGGCDHNCVQNHGEPLCDCPLGEALQSNGVSCEVTLNDPCLDLGCEHICLQSSCICRNGYKLQEDGKTCRDIDECVDEVICPGSQCINTDGSYECRCFSGFEKQRNGRCVDINECFMLPCEHECKNTEGNFTCSCFEGFIQRTDDYTKCKLHCDQRECPAQCDINIPTQCECPGGFVRDDRKDEGRIMCVDIDECLYNYCARNCTNSYGGYTCSCPAGFKLVKGYECEEYPEEGSGFTTPALETVTPTSNITKAVTPGALLGIMVCIVLMILIIVFLTHQMSKRRSSWAVACLQKSKGEDLRELQQVTKYTKKSSFVNRDLKEIT